MAAPSPSPSKIHCAENRPSRHAKATDRLWHCQVEVARLPETSTQEEIRAGTASCGGPFAAPAAIIPTAGKYSSACFVPFGRALNLAITSLASEPRLECAPIARTKSVVRPSCKKNSRFPTRRDSGARDTRANRSRLLLPPVHAGSLARLTAGTVQKNSCKHVNPESALVSVLRAAARAAFEIAGITPVVPETWALRSGAGPLGRRP
jgi:hypothetical protein